MKARSNFSSRIGYVLAAAGSAVGLGNIWRFPYLAARYGGGIFVLVYILLAVTFGYTMLISESSLGRKTRKSPVGAFSNYGKTPSFYVGGWLNAIIPMLIVPYYSVIGGWVCKYLFEYIKGSTRELAEPAFFGTFTSGNFSGEFWFGFFTLCILIVIFAGVNKGVEAVSKIMMPLLVVLQVVVTVYSVSRPGALQGVKYFLIPNRENFSWMTVVSAMGQMFYSLSLAMGILYTYGSYMKDEVNIEKSTFEVLIFDSVIAILAGLMIIPAVFAYSGGDPSALNAGPSLMFVTIPKVFASMDFGREIGIVFFMLVFLAALTSAISLTESAVSTFEDELKWGRHKATIVMALIMIVLGTLSNLGFGLLSNVKIIGMGILDFFDFLTNSVMMPLAAMATCILILYTVSTQAIIDEVQKSSKFYGYGVYRFCIKFIAPFFIAVILVSSILDVFGIIKM